MFETYYDFLLTQFRPTPFTNWTIEAEYINGAKNPNGQIKIYYVHNDHLTWNSLSMIWERDSVCDAFFNTNRLVNLTFHAPSIEPYFGTLCHDWDKKIKESYPIDARFVVKSKGLPSDIICSRDGLIFMKWLEKAANIPLDIKQEEAKDA